MSAPVAVPAQTEEQRELVAVLDAFVAERVRPRLADIAAADRVPDDLHARLGSQGLWSLGMPEEVGGGGGDLPTLVLALQRLATGSAALALTVAHAHAVVAVLADHAEGRSAAAEVAAGARPALVDLVRAPVTATAQDDGPVLDGAVPRVDAGDARLHLLLEPPGVPGGVALADPTVPGFVAGPVARRCGLAGATTRAIEFDGCHLARLAPFPATAAAASRGRIVLLLGAAAAAAGIAEAAATAAGGYLAERHQFGGPLAERPVLRRRLVALRGHVQAALDSVWARGTRTAGLAALPADEADTLAGECAAVAGRCTSTAVAVGADAVQLHGGYGYLEEYAVERLMRDAVSLRAAAAAIT
ncbi:MAG: hypothetical protein GEV03_02775 [Streptosporangiales bacterium]|nr:hypothetical protein [Streptosporangiales bacterium]